MTASPDGTDPCDDGSPGDPDGHLPQQLRGMWELLDPVPAGLAGRISFALEVEAMTAADLDLELMRLLEQQTAAVGSRGDQVRTITFGSTSMTVMLALSDVTGGYRVDGWVAPGGRRRLEVRTAQGREEMECDETGRFSVALVPRGHFQLVLQGNDGAPAVGTGLRRAVVTPALTL